jgi:hypothetical protein
VARKNPVTRSSQFKEAVQDELRKLISTQSEEKKSVTKKRVTNKKGRKAKDSESKNLILNL